LFKFVSNNILNIFNVNCSFDEKKARDLKERKRA